MERPPVSMLVQMPLLRRLLRAPRQQPPEPLPRILQVRLRLHPLGLRTFPMTLRGSITNSRPSTSKAASPSGNAAIIAGIPYGVAGVLGAAIAAVFV